METLKIEFKGYNEEGDMEYSFSRLSEDSSNPADVRWEPVDVPQVLDNADDWFALLTALDNYFDSIS